MQDKSKSLGAAKGFLGREVEIIIDRTMRSVHPEFGFVYEVNYGYIPGVIAPDGEDLDAYFLGADKPLAKARGKAVAIIHRLDDDDDKLVVAAVGYDPGDDEIRKAIDFQEKRFNCEILRG
jgi:inorganic pyrophosphatase